jgi:hypothetical protein
VNNKSSFMKCWPSSLYEDKVGGLPGNILNIILHYSHFMCRDEEQAHRNPDRPSSLLELQGSLAEEDETHSRKRVHRISSPEKWEIKQVCRNIMHQC